MTWDEVTWEWICDMGMEIWWHATVAWEWDWILTECCSLTHLGIANVFSQQCSLIGAPVTNNENFEQMIVCSGGVECTHRMLQAERSHVHTQWCMRVYCNDNKKATAEPLAERIHMYIHNYGQEQPCQASSSSSLLAETWLAYKGKTTPSLSPSSLLYCQQWKTKYGGRQKQGLGKG